MNSSVTVIPAAPGWNLLRPCSNENDNVCELWSTPIIAWKIEQHSFHPVTGRDDSYSCVTAITAEGDAPDNSDYAYELPDGKITIPDDRDFDSKGPLVAYFQDSAQRQRKAEEERKALRAKIQELHSAGQTNQQIADRLQMTIRGVERYLKKDRHNN